MSRPIHDQTPWSALATFLSISEGDVLRIRPILVTATVGAVVARHLLHLDRQPQRPGTTPTQADINASVAAAANSDEVVVTTDNAWGNTGQQALVRALLATGKPLTVVSMAGRTTCPSSTRRRRISLLMVIKLQHSVASPTCFSAPNQEGTCRSRSTAPAIRRRCSFRTARVCGTDSRSRRKSPPRCGAGFFAFLRSVSGVVRLKNRGRDAAAVAYLVPVATGPFPDCLRLLAIRTCAAPAAASV